MHLVLPSVTKVSSENVLSTMYLHSQISLLFGATKNMSESERRFSLFGDVTKDNLWIAQWEIVYLDWLRSCLWFETIAASYSRWMRWLDIDSGHSLADARLHDRQKWSHVRGHGSFGYFIILVTSVSKRLEEWICTSLKWWSKGRPEVASPLEISREIIILRYHMGFISAEKM